MAESMSNSDLGDDDFSELGLETTDDGITLSSETLLLKFNFVAIPRE